MTETEAIYARHSVRKYSDIPLAEAVVASLQEEIHHLNNEGNLRMQLILNEKKAFSGFLSYGIFSNVSNYILVIGKKSESLEYRAGYYSERLMLFAQKIGLCTCCVGMTYKKVTGTFEIADDEKIVVCIAIGYGQKDGYREHKIKSLEQVSNINNEYPEWFKNGVIAALRAPTAVNQQKFYFQYLPADKVRPIRRKSIVGFTKVDLGIAMYNFEIGAGRQNFVWVDSPLSL